MRQMIKGNFDSGLSLKSYGTPIHREYVPSPGGQWEGELGVVNHVQGEHYQKKCQMFLESWVILSASDKKIHRGTVCTPSMSPSMTPMFLVEHYQDTDRVEVTGPVA